MDNLVPVHIGLMGHIDHGKTALARAISDQVSTAGLDKHPQAQERGITIDLGFTMFVLDQYLVTLVDAPGHADLIRSVVAGANIIDTAILTVAADEGPKIQTGEHLVVLRSMDIDTVVIAITKSDLVDAKRLAEVTSMMMKIVEDAGFTRVEYVRVSAHSGQGIDDLREALLRIIVPRTRIVEGPVLMPIDHAFSVKGHGTVVTGTILRGHLSINDSIEFSPAGLRSKVRSIQTFGANRTKASAGDRVGVNSPDIDPEQITRGDYLASPNSIPTSDVVLVHGQTNPLYKERITQKMVISAAIGMPMVTAQIIPFEVRDGLRIVVDDIRMGTFDAALVLQRPIAIDAGAKVLLLRTDLPPSQMRIIGSGCITEVAEKIILNKRKIREGKVQRIRDGDVLVEGLASSKSVAESIVGKHVTTPSGAVGIIRDSFGTRGVISVEFDNRVKQDEVVQYERLVEEEYSFGS
ncbi:selenocysteine-specific translation elongation factor [Candidatus Thorarchaeota archaeon]|nr:MAG: selenocysteine-specific translation elongation factor [Candidatus Thorarchaeota archaeon]